jgi:hypothetical protein
MVFAFCLILVGTANATLIVVGSGPQFTQTHLTGTINWTNNNTYQIKGWVFVDSASVLNIQAGTIIFGDKPSLSALIIRRGAKIIANGTAGAPIILTSFEPAGSRAPGDWGGVILLGAATTNKPTTQQIEGGFTTQAPGQTYYGGSNDNDSSGVFRYVRIEFPGAAFGPDDEINGLTMGGVGRKTVIDHVQVSYSNDDDFEFFGGTVDAKYLVSWRSRDDTYDTDFGFNGRLQFCYTKRDVNIFGLAANDQSNGFESDNENNAATGHSALPRTKARVSNMTLIGPYTDVASAAGGNLTKWQHEALIRRSSEFSIYNSVLVGWPFGPQVRDTATQRAAVDNRLEIRNTSVGAAQGTATILTQTVTTTPTPVITFDPLAWFSAAGKNNLGSAPREWGPGSAINFTAAAFNLDATNNPVPGAGTELATAGSALDGRLTGDTWFTATSYRGAFDPAVPMSSQWTAGWTNFAPETYNPELSIASVPMSNGWNIVSLPVASPTPNDSVLSIYTNSTNPFGFAFAGGYVQRYVMAPGLGYWIKSSASYTQNITGTTLNSLTIGLSVGWNMIGSISTSVDTSAAYVTPTPPDVRGSTFFRYNNGYLVAATIEPGLGYWVKANAAGSFFMHSTGTTRPFGREQQPVGSGRTIEDLNSITIQDANGGSQTLYFGADGRGEISVDMFAMPPAPPVGSFDARFKSSEGGSMVQTHAEELNDVIDLPIAIQSVAYPLTVSWKVNSGSYELSDGVGGIHPVRGEGTLKIANSAVELIVLKVTGGSNMPREFALSQNYPNPFNPTTSIKYALPVDSRVTMKIYNALGQHVHTLLSEAQPAGYHVAEWNGKNNAGQQLASGMYFLQLTATGTNGKAFNDVRKLMMLK